MKDPIHTNNIYVGVAWFCHRSFLFSPPPHYFPPASSSSSAPSCRDTAQRSPTFCGTNTQSGGEGTSRVLTQPNSDEVSPEPPSSRVHANPHEEGPYHMFTREIFLEPSFMRERPSPGTVPTVAMLLRLQEVAWSLPSSIHPHQSCERGWETPLPSPLPAFRLIQTLCQGVWGWGEHANSAEAQRDQGLLKNTYAHTKR